MAAVRLEEIRKFMRKLGILIGVLCLLISVDGLYLTLRPKQEQANNILLISLPAPTARVSINQNGQVLVKVLPCETVTPAADYRDLLGSGYFYGGEHAVMGYPPFAATLVCCSTPLPPEQVTVVYEVSGSCETPAPGVLLTMLAETPTPLITSDPHNAPVEALPLCDPADLTPTGPTRPPSAADLNAPAKCRL